jgi:hypothetical protein
MSSPPEEDSDFSDLDGEENLESEEVNEGWLDEEDEIVEPTNPTSLSARGPHLPTDLPQSAYFQANASLYFALVEVEDLEFSSLNAEDRVSLMKSLTIERYQPG